VVRKAFGEGQLTGHIEAGEIKLTSFQAIACTHTGSMHLPHQAIVLDFMRVWSATPATSFQSSRTYAAVSTPSFIPLRCCLSLRYRKRRS